MERDRENGRRESKAGRVKEGAQAATWRHGRTMDVAFGPPRSGLVLLSGRRTQRNAAAIMERLEDSSLRPSRAPLETGIRTSYNE